MEYFRKCERFDIHGVYTIEKLMHTLGAEQSCKPYIDYFLHFLFDYGYISMEYGMFSFLPAAEALLGMQEVLDECRKKYPDCCAYMELCVHVAERYDDIFSGRVRANEVLYPNGSFELIESYEKRMPIWSYVECCTDSVAEIV